MRNRLGLRSLWLFLVIAAPLFLLTLSLRALPNTGPPPVRFIIDNGGAGDIPDAVRILCYEQPLASQPFADKTIRLDPTGHPLAETPVPAGCNFVAALHLLHVQPSAKPGHGPAFWHYDATSWHPNSDLLQPLTGPAPITVTLDYANPFTLFNVVVSVAWEPAIGSPVLGTDVINEALMGASAELYDMTEGRMGFGPIQIYTGGEAWQAADIRILPANDFRPAAYVGGLVAQPISYTFASGNQTRFVPSQIYLGRAWDGRDATAVQSNWQTITGTRTIAHEWAHYALFFFDEYYPKATGSGPGVGYCTCDALPGGLCSPPAIQASIMAYHYTANEFTLAGTHANCPDTWQFRYYEASDWDVLHDWFTIQGLGALPANPLPFPDELTASQPYEIAADLFGRHPDSLLYLPTVFLDSGGQGGPVGNDFTLMVELGVAQQLTVPLFSQLYILSGNPADPTAIAYQGRVLARNVAATGVITALGVTTADRARLYAHWPANGAQSDFFYPAVNTPDAPLSDMLNLPLTATSYGYTLTTQIENSRTLRVALAVYSPTLTAAPTVTLCSLDGVQGCNAYPDQVMTPDGSGWQATFVDSAGLPTYFIIRVVAPSAPGLELIRWVMFGGSVGPGHTDGLTGAPIADGTVMLNGDIPTLPRMRSAAGGGGCNAVSFMPATSSAIFAAPLPTGVTLVTMPLDISILIAEGMCPATTPTADNTLPFTLTLTLGYPQDELLRYNTSLFEDCLLMLHFDQGTGSWLETMPVYGHDEDLNWLAAAIAEDGVYAIGHRLC